MQFLAFVMIVSATTFDLFVDGDKWKRFIVLPRQAAFVPEILSAVVLVFVVVLGIRGRFKNVRPAYWIVFAALCLTMVCGIAINQVAAGPIFAGLRSYFRAMPWFLLPAVFAFSERQIRQQLKLLLAICFIQVPLAINQRMLTGYHVTGDWTTGTLTDSGILSIFLVGAVCILAALYERRHLSLWRFVLIFLIVLVPTMINETKVMVVILPISLLVAYLVASDPAVRAKRLVVGLAFITLFGAIFVPIYNWTLEGREYATTLQDFFSDEKQMDSYLSDKKELGSEGLARRGDAIRVPMQELLKDPIALIFGYGLSNVSNSNLGSGFAGKYARLWEIFMVTSFTKFILELGLIGFGLLLLVYYLIFQDCLALARKGAGLFSSLAAGWAGVTVLIVMCTFYTQIHVFSSITFLFWYFSGLIAAQRMRLEVESRNENQQRRPHGHLAIAR